MSGISAASAVAAARHALFEAFKVALEDEDEVDIAFGFRWPLVHNDWAALTSINADQDTATIGPRRSQDETITFHASFGSWHPGEDEEAVKAAFDRAFELLSKV